jgi:hypothetical protein
MDYLFQEDFMSSKWRPAMGWAYVLICLFDFMAAPVLLNVLQNQANMWQPVTLQGGGLFHVSMGAILGITSWTRGTEKIQRLQTLEQQSLNQQNEPAYPVWQNQPVTPPVMATTQPKLRPLVEQPLEVANR